MSYVLKSSDTEITINRSIIPETNDTVDIGSAERKIRDMYISNNSLWLGDDHKLAITSDGTMKFRKRDKTVLPKVLRDASGTEAAAINHVNQKYGTSFTNVSEFKLNHVLSYARTINSTYKTSDIYSDNTEDYEKETAADAWQVNSSKIFLGSDYTNIGIGTNNPNYPLEVKGIIKGDSTLYLGDVNTLSDGYLRIGKNNGTGGVRSFILHYNDSFDMCISDYGATTTTNTTPFKIAYSAPADSLYINSSGQVEVNIIKFSDGSTLTSASGGGGGQTLDLVNDTTYGIRTKEGRFRIYNEVASMGTHLYLSSTDENNYVNAPAGEPIGTIHFQINEDINAGGTTNPYLPSMEDYAKIEGVTGDWISSTQGRINGQLDFYTAENTSHNTNNIYKRMSIKYDGTCDFYNNNLKNINNLTFTDGSSISSNKLYLCKLQYVNVGNVAVTNTWVIPSNQFNTTFLLNPGNFTLGTNGVIIPVSGYYEITINNYFNDITLDRGSMISALAINGIYSNEDYICGSYIRFDSGTGGSRGNSGSIIRFLNAGDQISTAFYETGDSSEAFLAYTGGSSFTVKKIG